MEVVKTLITPNIAKAILEKNISNRNIRKIKIEQYAREMIEGNWKSDTFEFIKISKSGNLIDGQHRLMAIIKANIEIEMQIAYNVPDDVYSVLDTGINRNTGDVFQITGIKNAKSIPSIIKVWNKFKNESYSRNSVHYLSNIETLDYYNNDDSFWQELYRKSNNWYHSFAKILSQSMIGGFYAFTIEIDEDDAFNFMNQVCGGVGVKNKTINLLRNTLIKDKISTRKLPIEVIHIYLLKTWNAYRSGNDLKILKWNPENEKYPKAI